MSALIAPLIAIVLSAAVATVGLWNLGDAFEDGNASTAAASLLNSAKSIVAARALYVRDLGATPSSVADLVQGGYLRRVPPDPVNDASASPDSLSLSTGGYVELDLSNHPGICRAVNDIADIGSAPASPGDASPTGCTASGTFYHEY